MTQLLQPAPMRDEVDPSAIIAAHGLQGARDLSSDPLEVADWSPFLGTCRDKKILAQLVVAALEGDVVTPPDALPDAIEQLTQHLRSVVLLERDQLAVADLLDRHDLPFRIIKGLASGRLDYPSPALRHSVDVDLLVRGLDMEAVKAVLADAGYTRLGHERRPGYDTRFEKSITFRSRQGLELDLHRTFSSGPFGFTFDPDELFETSERIEVGGRSLPALAREERFIHACLLLVSSDQQQVRAARDVAEIMVHPDFDTPRALDLAARWQMSIVISRAVNVTIDWLDCPGLDHPLIEWAQEYQPSHVDDERMACYRQPKSASYVRRVVRTTRELPTVRLRAAYLLAMARPDPDNGMESMFQRGFRATRTLLRGHLAH